MTKKSIFGEISTICAFQDPLIYNFTLNSSFRPCALIWACAFTYLSKVFEPVCLFGSVRLFGSPKYISNNSVAVLEVSTAEAGDTVRPCGTRPFGTQTSQIHGFDMGPKIFQLHGFPNVGHSFTSQLHGY